MKKIITVILSFVLTFAAISCLCSCDLSGTAETIISSVEYPDEYSIAYDIESKDGVHTTLKKAVDSDGNVYYLDNESEMLFIKSGNTYTLYERKNDGEFVISKANETYNQAYVDNATAKFEQYAEQSRKQFMPTVQSNGEEVILNRTCTVYEINLGGEKYGINYTYFVDNETGICLGLNSGMVLAGIYFASEGENFTCTEFIVNNVTNLEDLI